MTTRTHKDAAGPEVRLGNCCGCNTFPVTLYRISAGVYRCAPCFETQTGIWSHLAPAKAEYERMQRESGR